MRMTEAEEKNEEEEKRMPPHHPGMMKKEAEEMMKDMFSEDVRQHLIKSGSEFLLALEAMMPTTRVSEEARSHYTKMRKEFLLMAKSVIDDRLEMTEGMQAGKGLKKIELD
jgi:hypothetical protein